MKRWSRDLKNWFNKKLVMRKFSFDIEAVHKEVVAEVLLDKNQIYTWFEQYLSTRNPLSHPYVEIGQLYTNTGQHERAAQFYSRFLQCKTDKLVHSLFLQNMLLSETATNQTLLSACKNWADIYDDPKRRQNWESFFSRDPKKKIKIGYVCHFFSNSISDSCLLPFFQMHDRSKFNVYCYDDGETSLEYQKHADVWRDIRGLSDEEVARMIRKDGIDILQELNGFCIVNRFGALSYRPAPIQINWYNHASTTGLSYIDYVMSDKLSIQKSDLLCYVEKPYLSDDFIAAKNINLDDFGDIVSQTPCMHNGYITFGYFGSTHKITLAAIRLWSLILHRVTNSKLMLKAGSFSHEIHRKIFLNHFLKNNIPSERIILEKWSSQIDTVQMYNQIDIMLDNVPVSGGSTMFEALTQGVPPVTLLGNRWAARSGGSVLTTLKHSELVAKNIDEYVDIVVRLSNDVSILNCYRNQLREDMVHSTLNSISHFYKNFENAYQFMWRAWCEQKT